MIHKQNTPHISDIISKNKRSKIQEEVVANYYAFLSKNGGLDTTTASMRFQKTRIVHTKRGKQQSEKAKRQRQTRKQRLDTKKEQREKEQREAYYKNKRNQQSSEQQIGSGTPIPSLSDTEQKTIYRPPILPD